MNIEKIHLSLVSGQREQMVKQIEEYGLYAFWSDYDCYLIKCYKIVERHEYFVDAVMSYHRIKNRQEEN